MRESCTDFESHRLIPFSNALGNLHPTLFPAFAFSWLTLISHRLLLPEIMGGTGSTGWAVYHHLLIQLFGFLRPFLEQGEIGEPIRALYKGTLRLLLVLLHDYPEFLSEFYSSLADALPINCTQMRNLILSAFPRMERYHDPFSPALIIEYMPEVKNIPKISCDFTSPLSNAKIRNAVDAFLRGTLPKNSDFFHQLQGKLLDTTLTKIERPSASRYNIPLVNCLVLYIGIHCVNEDISQRMLGQSAAQKHSFSFFSKLMLQLDPEGQSITGHHLLSLTISRALHDD